MSLLLLIVLLLLVFRGLPTWGYHNYGYAPSGIAGILLIIVFVVVWMLSWSTPSAMAQVSVGIGLPGVSIGINPARLSGTRPGAGLPHVLRAREGVSAERALAGESKRGRAATITFES